MKNEFLILKNILCKIITPIMTVSHVDSQQWKKKNKYHNCGKTGHFKYKCPELKKDYANFNYTDSVFNGIKNQDPKEDYLDAMQYWILLDNQSTTDIFCNEDLLTDIHEAEEATQTVINGGTLKITKKGTLEDYGEVWYHPKAITNILTLNNITKCYPVPYASRNGEVFTMHKPEGDRTFTKVESGLYSFDTRDDANFLFLMTSESIRSNYSRQEYETAKRTRDLHAKIGYLLDTDFKKIIKHGLVHNCDVTTKDVDNATHIFEKKF